MRMTRAQAAALQETGSLEETQDACLGEEANVLTLKGDDEAPLDASAASADIFSQSTRSTKSKKGSKRGKKNMDFAPEDLHIDEVTDGFKVMVMEDGSHIEQSGDVSQSQISDISFAASTNGSKRVASGGKAPVLIAVDDDTEIARPGSPTMDFNKSVLKPKSQAKQLLAKEKMGMRSTSNKENVQPGSPATAVASPQINVTRTERVEEQTATNEDSQVEGEVKDEDASPANVVEQTDETQTSDAQDETQDEITAQDSTVAAPQTAESAPAPAPEPQPAAPPAAAAAADDKFVENKPEEPVATGTVNPAPSATLEAPQAPQPTKRKSLASSTTKPLARSKSTKAPTTSTSRPPTTASRASTTAPVPHSKPRPISLSFPTPPPPPKSTRPATRPSFALPGEAVAAKLKAAKEARLAREAASSSAKEAAAKDKSAEVPKRAAFKARPAPKFDAAPAVVRGTKASLARESLGGGLVGGLGRTSSVRDAGKGRASMAGTERRASVAVVRPRPSEGVKRARPQSVIVTGAQMGQLGASLAGGRTSVVGGRPSMSSAVTGKTGTEKGKEVFKRAAVEKAEADRVKREKEAAAKKARAEAAERGRALSREWAERQKAKAGKAKIAAASS